MRERRPRRGHRRAPRGRRWLRKALRYVFPDHWSFLLGEIALYCVPRPRRDRRLPRPVLRARTHSRRIYHGPLRAAAAAPRCRDAYESTLDLSFKVPGGLLMRQTHHWAALVFVAAIVAAPAADLLHRRVPRAARRQLLHRRDDAGARRARGLRRLLAARRPAVAGWAWRSHTASRCRSRCSAASSRTLIWGGQFPGAGVIESRLYIAPRASCCPPLIGALIASTSRSSCARSTPSSAGRGATERNVVGTPMWPGYALRSAGLLARRRRPCCSLLGGLSRSTRSGSGARTSRASAPTAPSRTGISAG